MGIIVELSIFPMDKGISVSPYVARVVNIIKESGLSYDLNAMGTCMEGEWPDVMKVVDACFKDLQKDCGRIYLTMKGDYRKDRIGGLSGKVDSVRSQL